VCAGSACTGMIRNSYDLLFQNSSYHNKFRQLQKRTFELSEFLIDVLKVETIGSKFSGKVVFMDTCTGLNGCGIKLNHVNCWSKLERFRIGGTAKPR